MKRIAGLNRKIVFKISTLFFALLLMVLFWLAGQTDRPLGHIDITPEHETDFVNDIKVLDSLYQQLQMEEYGKNVSAIAQVNVQWEKHSNAFIARYSTNAVLSKHAAQVITNFRERVKVVKETYRLRSASTSRAEVLKATIKQQEATRDELKSDQQMIKQALLSI